MKLNILLLLLSVVLFSSLSFSQGGDLRKNYYKETCPEAESIIQEETRKFVDKNPNLPAKLLRMHFHDCFVRGCDASVLLKSLNNTAERDAIPNLSLSGFKEIDDIKAKLEKECEGVVSCADILALATRDAVSYKHSPKLEWEVLTGRRDGRVSIDVEALRNIPAPFFNFNQLRQSFENKGLTLHDLVVLSGGHTIGVGHCGVFRNRLYNFTGKGDQDPDLNPTYAAFLKTKCSPSDTTTAVEMDPGSGRKFDSSYYSIVKDHKGMFTSDAELLKNKQSSNTVDQLVKEDKFFTEFGQSMKRMGAIEVLTKPAGEIRRICSAVN